MTGRRECEILGLTWDRVGVKHDVLDISWQFRELKKVHRCGAPHLRGVSAPEEARVVLPTGALGFRDRVRVQGLRTLPGVDAAEDEGHPRAAHPDHQAVARHP